MIDWERFAQRVQAGTRVRLQVCKNDLWQGVLLENYPYEQEECIPHECDRICREELIESLRESPHLRFHNFADLGEGAICMPYPDVEYLIDGEWRTFEQIMTGDG